VVVRLTEPSDEWVEAANRRGNGLLCYLAANDYTPSEEA
jgi:hypothetical protein